MIHILAHDYLCQQARRNRAPFLQHGWQLGDDRGIQWIEARDVLASHQSAPEEPGRFVIKLLADLRPDATPVLRLSRDLLGIDHLFHDGQVFR